MHRIPTLDGWRGVAILLVLVDHFSPKPVVYAPSLLDLGQHGVAIFFVVSGFLITKQLVEYKESKQLSLRRFYIRRFFRLMPVAWCYLALILVFWRHIWPEVCASLLFYRSNSDGSLLTAHFWSLSVEEQFYLAWPTVLTLVNRNTATGIASACAIGIATFRYLHWGSYEPFPRYFRTEVRADAILVGCLLALLWTHLRFNRTGAWIAFAAAIVGVHFYPQLPPLFENCAWAYLIGYNVRYGSKLLEQRWLVSLGLYSYSVYVWQQPFMLAIDHDGHSLPLLILLPLLVLVSYRRIERPGRALGRKLEAFLFAGPSHRQLLHSPADSQPH